MVKISYQPIPKSKNKRPGTKIGIDYITIHSTANPASTAQNERDNLARPANQRKASFNWVIDDTEVIQCVPDGEITYHAGPDKGNRSGISIELCESGDRAKTLANAAYFVALEMAKYGIPESRVVTHNYWSGKDCPRILRNPQYVKNGMNWDYFKNLIKKEGEKQMGKEIKTVKEAVSRLQAKGMMDSPEYWETACSYIKNLSELLIKIASKI